MAVAARLWQANGLVLVASRSQLAVPLIVYLGNFTFATVMSLAAGYFAPVGLGLLAGILPAVVCWYRATPVDDAGSETAAGFEPSVSAASAMDIATEYQP